MTAADQKTVMPCTHFMDPLSRLMVLCFVSNVTYPREAGATLDLLQR